MVAGGGHLSSHSPFLFMKKTLPFSDYNPRMDYCFPEDFVDRLSRQEVYNKHLYRPNTYLHKWWARRCGSMFRTILKQFVADREQMDYYAPGGLEGKIVLDPMMGGGTTLHEAIRLGANVIGADIDSIPVVQARASLSHAALLGLHKTFTHFYSSLYDGLKHYFQTECPHCQTLVDLQYTLHGLRKACSCREVVQIDQYDLRHESDHKIRICPRSGAIGHDSEPDALAGDIRFITKTTKTCPDCGQAYEELLDLPFYARYVPFAIVSECPWHGRFFRTLDTTDVDRIRLADEQRESLDLGPKSEFRISEGPKSGDLLKRNIRSYLEVFSSRQLLYLDQAIRLLEAYSGVTKVKLGLLVSTSLEFNSMLCGYKGWQKQRPGAIRHVFSLHAYSFPFTSLENNPVNPCKASGNLQLLFRDRVERARTWASLPVERKFGAKGKIEKVQIKGETDSGIEVFEASELATGKKKFFLFHGDARSMPIDSNFVDLIATDPPYYDNVQYSNLAAFFRVWLKRLLPDEVAWNYDESSSAVATAGNTEQCRFRKVMSGIFAECARVLKPQTGRLVFTFHHWDPNAWADITLALRKANFRLMNAYVAYSENPLSVHIRNLKAIRHDSILVLTLAGEGFTDSWSPLPMIDTSDSETFCRQCSQVLGWLLDSKLSPEQIVQVWQCLITGSKSC